MEYLAAAVVFGILFGCFAFLDEKRKDMGRELNGLYKALSRQNDRMDRFREDLDGAATDRKELREEFGELSRRQVMSDENALNSFRAIQTATAGLEGQIKEMAETVKARDRQEQMVLEGMNNILNYNLDVARKAVGDDAE